MCGGKDGMYEDAWAQKSNGWQSIHSWTDNRVVYSSNPASAAAPRRAPQRDVAAVRIGMSRRMDRKLDR